MASLIACENSRFSSLFAAGDVSRGGTSATQRQKFHTDDAKSVRNLVRSANWSTEQFHCFSYCLRMTDKRQKAAKVKCKHDESREQNSQYLWNIVFSRRSIWDAHNTLPKSTRRNVKLNKFAFGTPWLLDLLCKHWFISSLWNFCRWVADVPPRETSPGRRARKNGCFHMLLRLKITWQRGCISGFMAKWHVAAEAFSTLPLF